MDKDTEADLAALKIRPLPWGWDPTPLENPRRDIWERVARPRPRAHAHLLVEVRGLRVKVFCECSSCARATGDHVHTLPYRVWRFSDADFRRARGMLVRPDGLAARALARYLDGSVPRG